MTVGTGARATCGRLVVIGVTGGTRPDFDLGFEAHRFGVALHAGHLRVRGVFEPNLTSSWLMVRNRNLHRDFLGHHELT